MSAGLVSFQNNKTHAGFEGDADQALAGGDVDGLNSLLLKSGGIRGFPGRNDCKGRTDFLYPGELLFEVRIFRQSDEIHRVGIFPHDVLKVIKVLLQLYAAFESKGYRGQPPPLIYGQSKFRHIADPGHSALNKRISGSQRTGSGVLHEIIQFARCLPAESCNFFEKSFYGPTGKAAEPLSEGFRKGRLRSQKNKIPAAQVTLQRRYNGLCDLSGKGATIMI